MTQLQKQSPSRVMILTAEYLDTKDLLVFTLKDLSTEKEQSYCWPPCDYFAAIGLPPTAKYTPKHLHDHCAAMIGKEINFLVEGEVVEVQPNIDPAKSEDIARECAEMAEKAGDLLSNELKVAQELANRRFGTGDAQ